MITGKYFTLAALIAISRALPKRSKSVSTFIPPAPSVFVAQWESIQKMLDGLENRPPIETMGAEPLAAYGGMNKSSVEFRFQTLIGTMLSPQTKDEQTSVAFRNLIELVSPLPLTAENLNQCELSSVVEAISMVSFYKVKAVNIKIAAERCLNEHDGDIPTDVDDLLNFRGVGPKIAFLTFTIARGETLGICVDTHVHRIANRLRWVDTWKTKSNGPEKTRLQLQSWLDREYWPHVNGKIVAFGQSICAAKAPRCTECELTESCSYFDN